MTGTSFHQAVLAIVDGDLSALTARLDAEPDLVRARSADDFRATLLHHVAANGVPDELQRSPANAVEIARLLLARGAEPDALSEAYGGGPNATTLCNLVSSWHPFERGVQVPLVHALVEGGASVDGVRGDGAPLATALVFGYTRASEALAACGARADALVPAAGLGDLAGVRAWFTDAGDLKDAGGGPFPRVVPAPPTSTDAAVVQEAFHVAASHDRTEVMEFLRSVGAELASPSVGHHCELPLCQAVFVHADDAARWLLDAGADLDLVDGKRGVSARDMLRARDDARARALLDR